MLKIAVRNFGPIREADLVLHRFMLLIGPQASGKSTLAKLIYFFLHVRDEVVEFVLNECRGAERERGDVSRRLTKVLRSRFAEFFGPAKALVNTSVVCIYSSGAEMQVSQANKNFKYVEPHLTPKLILSIAALVDEARGLVHQSRHPTALLSNTGRIASDQAERAVVELVRERCNALFGFEKELLFVPAGRSVLSTLSDQLQYIHPHLLDYPMRRFVDTVNRTRVFFDKSLDDLVTAKRALTSERIVQSTVREAKEFVQKILRGEYRYDKEGGKIFVNKNTFTKIGYASSGQQESVWILLSLFLLALEDAKALITIEEPEAHLFPDAQKDMTEFISYIYNQVGCDTLITTHSPYMLAEINNLIYAHELKSRAGVAVDRVIREKVHLDPKDVGGYFVCDGTIQTLKGGSGPFLRNEMLDGVSDRINVEQDALLSIERGEQSNARRSR